jgi:heat shock protein HtpX
MSATAAVLAISGGHQVSKAEEPELYRIVENLSIGSGIPMPKVWVVEDSAPNAFATGRNPQNAHVAATRGLLRWSRRAVAGSVGPRPGMSGRPPREIVVH